MMLSFNSIDLIEYIQKLSKEDWVRKFEICDQSISWEVDIDLTDDFPRCKLTFESGDKYILQLSQHFEGYCIFGDNSFDALKKAIKLLHDKRSEIENELLEDSDDETSLMEDEEFNFSDADEADEIQSMFSDKPLKESLYNVLSFEEVINLKAQLEKDIAEMFLLSKSQSIFLVQFFKGNREVIFRKLSEMGCEELFQEIGFSTAAKVVESTQTYVCPSCFDEVNINQTLCLDSCSHRFCNNCWNSYIQLKIKEKSRIIRCMQWQCRYNCGIDFVEQILSESDLEVYKRCLVEAFVEDTDNYKWCGSSPHCGNVFHVKVSKNTPLPLKCSCGYTMCCQCCEEPHLPVHCDLVKEWAILSTGESETLKWLECNTKSCPTCFVKTEKNQGCNHITCTKCQSHWCWACGGVFKADTVYSHKCPGYLEKAGASKARQSLHRYLFYFERFNVHKSSKKLESKTRSKVEYYIVKMYELSSNSPWIEQLWLRNAMEVLFNCRLGLQYSYVFSYYAFDPTSNKHAAKFGIREFGKDVILKRMKVIYEDTQAELETHVELLSKYIEEYSLEKLVNSKDDIVYQAVSCEKKLDALFDLIRTEFVAPSYILPNFPHVLTTNEHDE